ncbi:MAG: NAD-dependent epimerase/dehydratase family protein [Betaproteobacteria bacterium]|nr:NAD-dependent epimerase/dehydratase family protein [Betaproteobacteria bacterium]
MPHLPNPRTAMATAHDVVAAMLAWWIAFLLRFNFQVPSEYLDDFSRTLPFVVLLQTGVFWYFGLYRGIWRYASLSDFKKITLSVIVAGVVVTALLFMLRIPIPRSVLVLDPILLAFSMAGSRLAYRMWKERRASRRLPFDRQPVLVLGAGAAGANLVAELARNRDWRVVGVLDDDRKKRGRQIHGVTILGSLDELAHWCEELAVTNAIIALPAASHKVRRRAVELCTAVGIEPMTVPSYDDLVSGKVTVSQIRHVELDDLLGRDPVILDTAGLMEWVSGRTIMITGAGGSIGSELCRQVLRFRPRVLVLLELSEHALYCVEQELPALAPETEFVWAIGDVKNRERIDGLMAKHRPTIVFHAAAYKHVPLMEDENAWQALVNNVNGTRVLAESSIEHGVEKFVFVSTDKAVNPTNVMGASKRLAELVCQALQQPLSTRFVIVRFGNVLGSTGSVVPKFRRQIAAGGPVTVTHPEVRRYFMSIAEAAQLVLQAGLMGRGGEIFVLDMGEPVRIVDLARDLIRLSGFAEEDIYIEFTGLRPGEKLYEELLATDENSLPTPHPKLRIAKARGEDRAWLEGLFLWLTRSEPPPSADIRAQLAHWVPEYAAPANIPNAGIPATTGVSPEPRPSAGQMH